MAKFTDYTTIDSLNLVFLAKSKALKIWWILVTIIAFVAFFATCALLITKYFNRETTAMITVSTHFLPIIIYYDKKNCCCFFS
jgi:hypothetical protein